MEEEGIIKSIYKAARTIKRKDNTLYNALRSIYEDSIFVREIAQLWPQLPLFANLRCGLWYAPKFDATCYFKSTDGHTNNWSFNTSRLNFHVALLSGEKGGCIIVDSTRRGKRFPDSMSKTIPIWTCVLNRAIFSYLSKMQDTGERVWFYLWKLLWIQYFLTENLFRVACCLRLMNPDSANSVFNYMRDSLRGSHNWLLPCVSIYDDQNANQSSIVWDTSLHLPLWVSDTEKAAIEERLEEWTKQLETCGADIGSLVSCLKKPLRPLWISQKTVIWLNEVPEASSWDFTPIILLSTSAATNGVQHRTTSEFSWNYIPGAGDDEESWARGLSPNLFWSNVYDIINSGPDVCNQKVASMVEKDRVYRTQRGQNAPQVTVKAQKVLKNSSLPSCIEPLVSLDDVDIGIDMKIIDEDHPIYWLGSTNVAVGTTQIGTLP